MKTKSEEKVGIPALYGVKTPWHRWVDTVNFKAMRDQYKTKQSSSRGKTKNLTLGELITRTYSACGEKRASNILQLAMEAQIIKLSRQQGLI